MHVRRLFVERLEERALLAVYTVDTDASGVDAVDGLTSFAEALAAADLAPDADVIEFAPTLAGHSIAITNDLQETFVDYDVEVRGLGSDQLTFFSTAGSFPGFNVASTAAHFTLSGARISGNPNDFLPSITAVVNGSSANVRLEDIVATGRISVGVSAASATLIDTQFISSPPTSGGGLGSGSGVVLSDPIGTASLLNSRISGFARSVSGTGDVSVVDSTISDNGISGSSLGGVRSLNGKIEVIRSQIIRNRTADNGGGVSAALGVTIIDSTIGGNRGRMGGGVATRSGVITILRSTIADNATQNNANPGGPGGAIYCVANDGAINVIESTISGNHVTGTNNNGGAIYSNAPVTVSDSIFRDNHTFQALSAGGAIYITGAPASVTRSLFEGNSVDGLDSDGGAIWTYGTLTIADSMFRNNAALGPQGDSGAVHFAGSPGSISNSTFVGNQTRGIDGNGGAIGYFGYGESSITNSTITDNATLALGSDGGGVFVYSSALTVLSSTIASNQVLDSTSKGGGLAIGDPGPFAGGGAVLMLYHAVIADNTSAGTNPDLYVDTPGVISSYSLIESTAGLTADQLVAINSGSGNLLGVDPMLAPLADNGGPTWTRALLPGSPAINMGDPAATYGLPNVPRYDQRGFPYDRISGVRIDMGALETQPTPAFADFNHDFAVDGADLLSLQRGLGKTTAGAKTDGDADNDGDVDVHDLALAKAQFGQPAGAIAAVSAADAAPIAATPAALAQLADLDDAFALTATTRVGFRAARRR